MTGVRGVSWLVWRQHRTTLWALLAFTVLVAGFFLYGGSGAADATSTLAGCVDATGPTAPPECSQAVTDFQQQHQYPLRQPLQVLQLLPLVFGLFLGAPLFAQEVESGTYRTALAQSVPRNRWFRAKVTVPVVMTVLGAGAITACATWWWHAVPAPLGSRFPWHGSMPFAAVGPAPVAKALLVLAIGITLGLLVRRTVAAMAATAVTGAVVLFALEHVRGALWPTVVAQRSDITAEPAPDGAWILNGGLVDTTGRRVPESSECYASTDYGQCLAGKGITGRWTEFHPASHFWPLQWTQTGLCLAASAALIALCFWWTRHRLT